MINLENYPPECPLGYTRDQIERLLGEESDTLWRWMNGQTMAICDGRAYDHDLRKYVSTDCCDRPHGMVVYPHDLYRFIWDAAVVD